MTSELPLQANSLLIDGFEIEITANSILFHKGTFSYHFVRKDNLLSLGELEQAAHYARNYLLGMLDAKVNWQEDFRK